MGDFVAVSSSLGGGRRKGGINNNKLKAPVAPFRRGLSRALSSPVLTRTQRPLLTLMALLSPSSGLVRARRSTATPRRLGWPSFAVNVEHHLTCSRDRSQHETTQRVARCELIQRRFRGLVDGKEELHKSC